MYNSKVIFLDMDGVVNNSTQRDLVTLRMTDKSGKDCGATLWGASNIIPFLKLMKWCYDKGINLVISSTWRLNMTPQLFEKYLYKYFGRNDLPLVLGMTGISPYPNYMHRGIEIQEYLNNHKEITQYMCIDDDTEDILENIPKQNVYKTDGKFGLTKKDVANIKKQWYNL